MWDYFASAQLPTICWNGILCFQIRYMSALMLFFLFSPWTQSHRTKLRARSIVTEKQWVVCITYVLPLSEKQEIKGIFLLSFWATMFCPAQNRRNLIFFVINIFYYFACEIKPEEQCEASWRPIRFIAAGLMQATNSKFCIRFTVFLLSFFSCVYIENHPRVFCLDMDVLDFHDLKVVSVSFVSQES